jgi:signal transduction histidine kinase/ligand-binding sensor domain-containing protein
LWVGSATGLWRWKPEPAQRYFVGDRISAVIEGDDGVILCGVISGMKQLVDSRPVDYQPAGMNQEFRVSTLLRDHDGGLWIGTTDRGLLHVHRGRTDQFSHSDGLSSDYVIKLVEDKEGNIWVATLGGLDRFRNTAATTISLKQGLSNAFALSVLASNEGIWIATANGLDKWVDGRITVYRTPGTPLGSGDDAAMAHQITVNAFHNNLFMALYQDEGGRVWVSTRDGVGYMDHGRFSQVRSVPPGPNVWAIAGSGAGNIWISQDNGLYHLLNGSTVEKLSWTALQRQDYAIALLPDPLRGGLWLGFARNGVGYLKDGRIQASYTEAEGLGNSVVDQLRLGPDGAVWAATQGGLSRITDGHIATLTSKNGLPCDTVHWSVEDEDHSVWLYMPCGLVRIDRAEFDSWVEHPDRTVKRTVLDGTDGVTTVGLDGMRVIGFPTLGSRTRQYSPLVAKSADGRLWFLPGEGVSVIDPRHVEVNKLAPSVHIEQITADRKTYDALPRLRLPALIRDLEIDYTALSLVAPEKNLFRYKLEGVDRDWHDVGNRRQAFYNDLSPGKYSFRVVASNNSGVWNAQGDTLDFTIAPAYWQTYWFRTLCALAILGLLWMAYLLRLRQLTRAFNMGLEARLSERMRIARDLHDTLLQSFQGLLLRFQTVAAMLPTRPEEAKEVVLSAVDQAAQAITQGRRAVQGLRGLSDETSDFATDLRTAGELAARETGNESVMLGVEVEGSPRTLQPLVRDEIYRIACEALRNAFRHAQARLIEVELEYQERQLRLRVRDNGQGVDPKILEGDGQTGHFGLHGMRERAKLIEGQLDVWSAPAKGTEVELSVPASRAYAAK